MTETLLLQIQQSTPYWLALAFFAAYPIVTSIMWIITALIFRLRWENAGPPPRPDAELPFVTVLVPAFNEEAVIARSVAAMLRLDYPAYEVLVVDDGSTDGTIAALEPLRADPRLRIARKLSTRARRWR
jgi:biofilm PGA synthesis N-glycosyltransferase PgaC